MKNNVKQFFQVNIFRIVLLAFMLTIGKSPNTFLR